MGTTMKHGQGRGDDNDEDQEEGAEDEGPRWQGQDERGDNNGADEDEGKGPADQEGDDDQGKTPRPGRPEHPTPPLRAAARGWIAGGRRREAQ
jgi:hypothetical protein